VHDLPVGLSFIGPAWSEAQLLAMGSAFEHAAAARKPPGFLPSLENKPDIAAALAPVPR
jgi:amidase